MNISKTNNIPVLVVNRNQSISSELFTKNGAQSCLNIPLNRELLIEKIDNALKNSNETIIKEKKEEKEDEIVVSKNSILKNIDNYINKISPSDISVLIQGETGVGKEVYARMIHNKSRRKDKPFVALDCGAIPTELANSELFGHVKGAFTGAVSDKSGAFVRADGGTLFLDEIGNLQYNNQLKLLRALQENVITMVGGTKEIKVDVRIIAATNDDIFTLVDKNNFREDLFHRLNEFRINIPPLRNRKEDLDDFIGFFIAKYNKRFKRKVKGFNDESLKLLKDYNWPGNIRELSNVMKRAVLLSEDEYISQEALPNEVRDNKNLLKSKNKEGNFVEFIETEINEGKGLRNITAKTEKIAIEKVLKDKNMNKSEVAKTLNIDRKTLYNKMDDYDLDDKKS